MEIYKKIKPLSINKAFQGRRFKTAEYKNYEAELLYTLPTLNIPKNTKLCLEIEVGFSNKMSDLSNILKPFEDILCKKYDLDDKWNYKIILNKKIVEKGNDYLKFSFTDIDNPNCEL